MKTIPRRLISSGAFLLFVHGALAQGGLTPTGAPAPTMKTLQQIEPRTPISSLGFTITQPGSYYVTTNLSTASGFGIRVNSDDVILDLGGWTIGGVSGTTEGIGCQFAKTNITIRNGTVRGFQTGVQLAFTSNAKVEGITAVLNNGRGIYVGGRSIVVDCSAIRNASRGIETGVGCEVRACRADENGTSGIVSSDNTVIRDSFASANGSLGFSAGKGCSLFGCMARDNIESGISAGEYASVRDCSAKNNGSGIVTGLGSSIWNSAATGNTGTGFQGSAANNYVQVNAFGNGSTGILLFGDGTQVQRSIITGNTNHGILLDGASVISDCLISSNGISGAATAGILVVGTRNRIENNTFIRNGSYGIWNGFLGGATNNLIIRNQASGHTGANFSVGAANHFTAATGSNVTTNLNPYVNFSLP